MQTTKRALVDCPRVILIMRFERVSLAIGATCFTESRRPKQMIPLPRLSLPVGAAPEDPKP
jgi:hypothetical protein